MLRQERKGKREEKVIVLSWNVKLALLSGQARELPRPDLEAERGGGCDIITLQGWFVRVESSPATIYHLTYQHLPSTI